jgi:hypothetical protein
MVAPDGRGGGRDRAGMSRPRPRRGSARASSAARRVRRDPEYERVNAQPNGRELQVTAADGTELHVELFGPEAAPTIVLVHGWTCALRFSTYQIQELPPEFRVVAWDLRGHRRSARAAGGDCWPRPCPTPAS